MFDLGIMPGQISDGLQHGKQWLTSTAGAPVRATYDFLFPPLDELFQDDTAKTRAAARSTSLSASPTDESFEQHEVWDTFSESPWSFVTSRYAVALAIVAIVNNRVQHICRPRGGATARLSQVQRIALRLPSLVLLARSVLILTTVVADAFLAESNPVNTVLRSCTTSTWRDAWLGNMRMSGWASDWFGSTSRDDILRARDASALWAAFTSTCVAVISDTMVRNLDAEREEPPAFNLVGFAFLLHFHSFSPETRANEHVYLCILLQMLQILTIALSRCGRPVYARRLVISSVFGIASLLHYALAAKSGRYPFLEALSRTPEIALVLVILLTVTLHALTMLLLEGEIQTHRLLFSRSNLPSLDEDWSLALFKLGTACMESTRLTGLERQVEPLVAWDSPYIELGRNGRIELVDPLASRTSAALFDRSSSWSASGSAGSAVGGGLSREVKQVRIEPSVHGGSSALEHAGLARIRALLHLATVTLLVARSIAVIGLRKVLRAVGLPDPSVPSWVYRALRLVRLVWHGQNGEARRRQRQAAERQRIQQEQQHRSRAQQQRDEQMQQCTASWSQAATTGATSSARSMAAMSPRCVAQETDAGHAHAQNSALDWQRFGAGCGVHDERWQSESDESDNDYDDTIRYEDDDSEADQVESDVEVPVSAHSVERDEVSGLLAELESFAASGDGIDRNGGELTRARNEAFNQLLLAHLTRAQWQPPLTRSRYSHLLSSHPISQADIHLAHSLHHRRSRTPTTTDITPRLCVVCCAQERSVICWPCRCLSLCMDCREHLASFPPTHPSPNPSHLCPTCRTPVQAFSRLYIP